MLFILEDRKYSANNYLYTQCTILAMIQQILEHKRKHQSASGSVLQSYIYMCTHTTVFL